MISLFDANFAELLSTVGACWGVVLAAGVGIAALPWTDAELSSTGHALKRAAAAPVRWLAHRREVPAHSPALVVVQRGATSPR